MHWLTGKPVRPREPVGDGAGMSPRRVMTPAHPCGLVSRQHFLLEISLLWSQLSTRLKPGLLVRVRAGIRRRPETLHSLQPPNLFHSLAAAGSEAVSGQPPCRAAGPVPRGAQPGPLPTGFGRRAGAQAPASLPQAGPPEAGEVTPFLSEASRRGGSGGRSAGLGGGPARRSAGVFPGFAGSWRPSSIPGVIP